MASPGCTTSPTATATPSGIFQMRPVDGLGFGGEVTDPTYAVNKFYDVLLAVPDWENDAARRRGAGGRALGLPGRLPQVGADGGDAGENVGQVVDVVACGTGTGRRCCRPARPPGRRSVSRWASRASRMCGAPRAGLVRLFRPDAARLRVGRDHPAAASRATSTTPARCCRCARRSPVTCCSWPPTRRPGHDPPRDDVPGRRQGRRGAADRRPGAHPGRSRSTSAEVVPQAVRPGV